MKKLNYLFAAGMVLLFLAGITLNFSCRNMGKKPAEQSLEHAIEQSSGEDADVDITEHGATITVGDHTTHINAEANSWPSGMPSEVPEFKYGKIKGVTTSDHPDGYNWTVIYEEVSADALKKYNDELKAKGFETFFMDMGGQGGSIGCEQGDLLISIMGGDGTAVVGVTKKKPE